MKTTNIFYKTILNTIHFDENGKITTNSQEFIFEESNPLKAREKALRKAIELNQKYNSNQDYDHPIITMLKSYKDSNGYSVNVSFEGEIFGYIFGEDLDDMIDDMSNELDYYKSIGIDVSSKTIEVNECNYEVVSDNLGLILQFAIN
jgi:hypothetical protein